MKRRHKKTPVRVLAREDLAAAILRYLEKQPNTLENSFCKSLVRMLGGAYD